MMPGDPVCSIIVFCDYVIVEQTTGKNSLIGTFGNLGSLQFPFVIPSFFVHVNITNFIPGSAAISLAVNLKHVQTGGVVGSVAFPIQLPSLKAKLPPGGAQINLNVPLQNVNFPAPGAYECEVLFDGERIGSRILEVTQHKPSSFTPPQNLS